MLLLFNLHFVSLADQRALSTNSRQPDGPLFGSATRFPGNHHNGYTSGTEDCPFWVEAMPALPANAIFPRPSIQAWLSWYRKG
jgi:hypothetical protein